MSEPLPQPTNPFVDHVISYLNRCPFLVIHLAVLGPGVIATQDDSGEYEFDAYFDPTQWTPIFPEIWGDGLALHDVAGAHVHVLQGKSRVPWPTSFTELLAYAKQQLKPVVPGISMNDHPTLFSLR